MNVPRKIVVDHLCVTGLGMQWGSLRFPDLRAMLTWLSKHDYRYVLDSCGLWVLP